MQKKALGRLYQDRRVHHQIFLAMRMTAILLTMALMQVHASGNAQSITLSGKDLSLKKIFKEIRNQTGYSVFYNQDLLLNTKPVTLNERNTPLEVMMKRVLKDQPLGFVIKEKTVVLFRKEIKPLPPVMEVAENVAPVRVATINGRVLNPDGLPLEGASVLLKGTKKGTSTDRNGRFTIDAGVGDVLVISYSGFATREYTVTTEQNFTLTLQVSENKLDEVVVKAYGTTTKRLSTANSGSITAKDIERQPVTNVLTALQGQVPGLFISQGSGTPGATMTVKIQGYNSLIGGNDPFYVVDGVPYSSGMLATGGNGSMWGFPKGAPTAESTAGSLDNPGSGSPFSYLNPSDIESIEVLKDADATSIYGSRAANGAIVITTKKGKPGAMRVTMNLTNGWNKIMKRVKLLNVQQYLELRREVYQGNNLAIPPTAYDINGTWDTTHVTDWQDYFWGKSSQYMNGQLSVSGGNAYTSYLVSANYNRQELMIPGNFASKNISTHLSLSNSSSNQRFKSQLSLNYLVNNNRLPATSITANMLTLSPVAPPLLNADGSINWAQTTAGVSTRTNNPMATILNNYMVDANNLIGNLMLSYQLMKRLSFSTSLGYTYMQFNDLSTIKSVAVRPERRANTPRSAGFTYNSSRTYLVEPQLHYQFSLSRLKVDVLTGATIQKDESTGRSIMASGQNSDNVLENLAAATTITSLSNISNVFRYNALFGSVNLNYSNRYILNLTGRRDGSSRFGPANRFHDFGSAAGAWILSEEPFVQLPSFMSFAKLRLSYGTTGNGSIGDYTYLDLYNPMSFQVPYQGTSGLEQVRLVNDQLQWEVNRKASIGADLGFFRDRFFVGAGYSRNRSSNLLQGYTLPATTGLRSITRNFPGTVQNTTWEFTLSGSGGDKKGFSWSMNANLTIPRNKLVSLPDKDRLPDQYTFGYIIGEPLGTMPKFRMAGVDPLTGAYRVLNSQGVAISNWNYDRDRTALINPITQKYYAGMNIGLGFKGVRLDMFCQGVKQMGERYYQGNVNSGAGSSASNDPIVVMDRWRKPGDVASFRKAGVLVDIMKDSDAAYEDASFVRFKNVSLSWDVPISWIRPAHLQACRISANVQNLATITKYSGVDPESGVAALPPFRTIVLGVQVTF